MPLRRSPTRAVYAGLGLPRLRRKRRGKTLLLLLLGLAAALALHLCLYLRSLSSGTALSDAQDYVTLAVQSTVNRVLAEKGYGYGDLVALEKDAAGNITALVTDTAKLNLLSSELQMEIARAADSGRLDVSIPLGDLLGAGVLQGRGPVIPVRVGMLTSSFLRFENEFSAAGINQTRHALSLLVSVDVDLLVPMGSMHTTVETRLPVAETIIVGPTPNTYWNTEHRDGSF